MQNSSKFHLIQEMFETLEVIKNINQAKVKELGTKLGNKILLTGEGSSRIFPAKRLIYEAQKKGYTQSFITDGAYQSSEYNLREYSSIITSNSGRTKECIYFCSNNNSKNIIGLTCTEGSLLTEAVKDYYILKCGKEEAVAATKSVIEQALFYDILFRSLNNEKDINLTNLSNEIKKSLEYSINEDIIKTISNSENIYRAGRNDGVAEELALKTNEITHKKSQFLEGTYLLHGIEEVMTSKDCIIVIDPRLSEVNKIQDIYDNIGTKILFISISKINESNIQIANNEYKQYNELAIGRNILTSIGLYLGINLDKPERARKIGNEKE